MRAYACGRDHCWPSDASTSRSCFATSKELLDHGKLVHGEEEESVSDRPYRCALSGCGKSWKVSVITHQSAAILIVAADTERSAIPSADVLEPLDARLYLTALFNRSTVHFRNAVSSTFNATEDDTERPSNPAMDAAASEQEIRTHICHHPQCFKAYKQPSGLRYHLKHVRQSSDVFLT
jgi:hypothetical protein